MVGGRAITLSELEAVWRKMFTAEGLDEGLSLHLRPSDVVISPFAKCGTTWIQQIVHTLRTAGDEDYDDISRVVPWIETSSGLGIDLDAEQKSLPRAFKSHLPWDMVPKGGRYITSIRDPRDALVSMYRFMEGWWMEPGAISIAEYARGNYLKRGEGRDYWFHLKSWFSQRDNPVVLLLAYENMLLDSMQTIRRIADFIGVSVNDELLAITESHSSLAYMLEHKDRFDDLLMRLRSETVGGLPTGSDSAKVRKGEVGSHKAELPAEIIEELDQVWDEEITQTLGFADYSELLDTF